MVVAHPGRNQDPWYAQREALDNDFEARLASLEGDAPGPNPLTGWLHVDGYGAVMDGATDNTAAILAAFADIAEDARTVYFPPGVCLANTVDAGVVLSLANQYGVTLKGNPGASILRTTSATAD